MNDLDPEACAQFLVEQIEKEQPAEWTTEQLATFWHRLTEHCTLRLIRLKPEMVRKMPPESRST